MVSLVRKHFNDCILFIFGVLVGFIILEGGIRLFDYQPHVTTPPYFYTNHPKTFWTLSKDFKAKVQTPDGTVLYQTNNIGVRHSQDLKDANNKIFVIGDSYTFGIGVNEEDTFVYQWQRLIDDITDDYSVVNLGVPGFGTIQAYERLKEYGSILGDPKVIIYMLCGNDYVDNLAGNKVIINGIRIDEKRKYKWAYSFIGQMYYKVRSVSFLCDLIYDRFLNPRKQLGRSLNEEDEVFESRVVFERMIEVISDMKAWADKNESQFFIVETGDALEHETVRKFFKNKDINFITYDEMLGSANQEDIRLKEGHWNNFGHSIVARHLHKEVFKGMER